MLSFEWNTLHVPNNLSDDRRASSIGLAFYPELIERSRTTHAQMQNFGLVPKYHSSNPKPSCSGTCPPFHPSFERAQGSFAARVRLNYLLVAQRGLRLSKCESFSSVQRPHLQASHLLAARIA